MLKLRSGAFLAAVAGLTAGSAQAADLYQPEVVLPPAEPAYQAVQQLGPDHV